MKYLRVLFAIYLMYPEDHRHACLVNFEPSGVENEQESNAKLYTGIPGRSDQAGT